jgi:PhnB protein
MAKKKAKPARKAAKKTAKRAAPKRAAPKKVQPVPPGMRTVTHYMIVESCADALAFYAKAFGAKELMRMPMPSGRIGHAEMKIGDSVVYIADSFPDMGHKDPKALGGSPAHIHLYVKDVNAAWDRAVAAGCTVKMPLADMFWGDRYGQVTDPFGHVWSMAQHVKDLSPAEMAKAAEAAFAAMPKPGGA